MTPEKARELLEEIQKRRARARRAAQYFERQRIREAEEAAEIEKIETKIAGGFGKKKD